MRLDPDRRIESHDLFQWASIAWFRGTTAALSIKDTLSTSSQDESETVSNLSLKTTQIH